MGSRGVSGFARNRIVDEMVGVLYDTDESDTEEEVKPILCDDCKEDGCEGLFES